MFIDERAGLVRMAFETDRILRGRGPQLPVQETTVRIVAVRALDHSFIHPVMEWPLKLLRNFLMAAIAKLQRFFLHQVLGFFGMMR